MKDLSKELNTPAHEGETSISVLDNWSVFQLCEVDRKGSDESVVKVPTFRLENMDYEGTLVVVSIFDPMFILIDNEIGEPITFKSYDEFYDHLMCGSFQPDFDALIARRIVDKVKSCIESFIQ